MKRTAVEHSIFSELFEDVGAHEVYLLSDEDAQRAWVNLVDEKASSYFDLPNSSWLVTGEISVVGSWLPFYNADDRQAGRALLEGAVDWKPRSEVLFLVKKTIVLQSTWASFCALWDNFLAVEDDCPMLIRTQDIRSQALLFQSLGTVLRIDA